MKTKYKEFNNEGEFFWNTIQWTKLGKLLGPVLKKCHQSFWEMKKLRTVEDFIKSGAPKSLKLHILDSFIDELLDNLDV